MPFVNLFKNFSAAQTLCLILSIAGAVFGQTPLDEKRELPPDQTLEREMTGAETHRYQINLKKNEFFQVRVEQKGIDVALKLTDANGMILATMDSPNDKEGPETLTFVAAVKGIYTLEVGGFDAKAEKGNYAITRQTPRKAAAQDKFRVEVERTFVEAVAAQIETQRLAAHFFDIKNQSEKATAKTEEALRGWRELKDDYLIGLTEDHLKILESIIKKDRAQTISGEGNALFDRKTRESMQAALSKYEEARKLYGEAGDKYWESSALYDIGRTYFKLGESGKAEEFFNLAVSLSKDTGDEKNEIGMLISVGKYYLDEGELLKSVEYYNRVVTLYKNFGNQRGEADFLNFTGKIYLDSGDAQNALDHYKQAAAIYEQLGDKANEAKTLDTVGIVYARLDDRPNALEYYKRSLQVSKDFGLKKGEADTLIYIGEIYSSLGEKEKALDFFKQSLQISEAAADKSGKASAGEAIGTVYLNLGNKEKALESFKLALPVFRESKDKGKEAAVLLSIGSVQADLGQRQDALVSYNQALTLYQETGDKLSQAYALLGIGTAYLDSGDKFNAAFYLKQALPLFRFYGNKVGEAGTLNNLGTLYKDLGNHLESVNYYVLALPISKAVGDRRGEAVTLDNLAYAWQMLGNRRLAIFYGKQAVNIFQSLRADIKDLDQDSRQSFRGAVEDSYRRLAELLIVEQRLPEAEKVLRMLKEEEYFEFVSRDGRVVSSLNERVNLNPAEQQAAEQYKVLALETARIYTEAHGLEKQRSGVSAEQIEIINAKAKELNKKLDDSLSKLQSFIAALSQNFADKKVDSKNVEESSQTIVKSWNDPHAVVISTIVGTNNLSLIFTTANFQHGFQIPISEKKLNKLISDFRTAVISNDEKNDENTGSPPAAQELYDILIAPVEKDLQAADARTLVWSLDKSLRYAPLAALRDKDQGYLVQRYANVVLALAGRQNLAFRPAGKNLWQALGVGVSKGAEDFAPLEYVPGELKGIVRSTASAQAKTGETGIIKGRRLLDDQFTYDNFVNDLGKYQFTHAATHFKFISGTKDEGLNSFLLLGGGAKLTLAQIQNSNDIFAGIELLTLSACDTGYGGATSDGREIEGLGVLAQKKGARAVMATLWSVEDESTSKLMIDFYKNYRKPDFTKAEALRQAQLTLLQDKDYASPYYWSPFILIGNWR